MSDQATVRLTGDDLLDMPTGLGKRYELIEGELHIMAPAGGEHGEIAATILGYLFSFVQQAQSGRLLTAETGFYTRDDNHTVRAPDAAFIPHERVPPEGIPKGYLRLIPALVVEVVSPNDRAVEVERKTMEWLNFGVDVVWVVYPEPRRVHVFRQGNPNPTILAPEATLEGDTALPGFQLPVARIFPSDK